MSERRVETVRVGAIRKGGARRTIFTESHPTLPRAILIHLAPNEPTIGEMAETPKGTVFKVRNMSVYANGNIYWSGMANPGGTVCSTDCTLHTPPETVDGVPVEDLRAVLDAFGRQFRSDDHFAAAARLRKKIEGADK